MQKSWKRRQVGYADFLYKLEHERGTITNSSHKDYVTD
jgi:hypothetical protein